MESACTLLPLFFPLVGARELVQRHSCFDATDCRERWWSPHVSPLSFAIRDDPPVEAAAPAPYDWLQMNGNSQHSGNNTQETVLGPTNVANLALFFQVSLPAAADGAPVALSSVATPSGTQNLLFSTTKLGHILALDADTGAIVWSHVNSGTGSTNASPAIDPSRLFVY